MIEEPIHVTDATFENAVLNSALPVIVDFWAPWCGPCKMLSPVLDQAAKTYAGKLIVAKVNVDDDDEMAGQYGVQSIPTMLFVKNGKVQFTHTGFIPAAQLDGLVQDLLA